MLTTIITLIFTVFVFIAAAVVVAGSLTFSAFLIIPALLFIPIAVGIKKFIDWVF